MRSIKRALLVFGCVVAMLAATTSAAQASPPSPGAPRTSVTSATHPGVSARRAPAPYFSVFPLRTKQQTRIGSLVSYVTTGPDGAVWCTEFVADAICRVKPDGSVQEFPLHTPPGTGAAGVGAGPEDMVTGPDGNLWFTNEFAPYLSRFTPRGHVLTTVPIPAPAGAVTTGPDHNLWFTAGGFVYRMSPRAPYPLRAYRVTQGSGLGDITTGPDGNLWFLIADDKHGGAYISRINPATGTITYFDYDPNEPQSYSGITAITPGPHHTLWVSGGGANAIITLSTNGSDAAIRRSLHDYDLPTPHSIPADITQDSHGTIWFTEKGITHAVSMITPTGHITEFPLPTANCPASDFFGLPGPACQPTGITTGPDGRLWIAENGANAIARMDTHVNLVTGNARNVTAPPGQATIIDEADVSGGVTAYGASSVVICSSIVRGNVTIHDSTGAGYIGATPQTPTNCQGGQIKGFVSLTGNRGGFAIGQYMIGGDLTVSDNDDGRLDDALPQLRIEGNTIAGALECTRNTPEPPADEDIPNTVTGGKKDQCATL